MIYDMRTYDIAIGKTPEYMAAVREIALPVRESYGVKLAGWYYTDVGALNKVVHIWAYRDYAHFEEAREAFRTDERWVNDYVPRVKGIVLRQENQIMLASDFFESILMQADAEECEAEAGADNAEEKDESPTDDDATDTGSMNPVEESEESA